VTRRADILAELGLTPIWLHRERLAENDAEPELQRRVASPAQIPDLSGTAGAQPVDSMDWAALREAASKCTACTLHEKRKQAVLGVGDEQADWLFVGEAPGAEEDARGEPFVGQAGRLLDNMLKAIGLARGKNVYIANVVKCRPPGNRNPAPEETQACQPFLDRQVALIQPRLIVALGKVAANTLLGRSDTLGSMRKTVHDYRGIPLIVTYHPAYLLRTLTDKAKTWEDLCYAVETLSASARVPHNVD
jgi:uracil-DNA glycosylase family 4